VKERWASNLSAEKWRKVAQEADFGSKEAEIAFSSLLSKFALLTRIGYYYK
jgi:hypothetical protein